MGPFDARLSGPDLTNNSPFVKTSVNSNTVLIRTNPHSDDHTIQTTDTPGFKPFTTDRDTHKQTKADIYSQLQAWLVSHLFIREINSQ